MCLVKKTLELSLIIMVFSILCSSQIIPKTSSDKAEISEREVGQWTAYFTDSVFSSMNPRETLNSFIFFGNLTSEESKLFPRKWLNPSSKNIPLGLSRRYLFLVFERNYSEMIFSIGTRKFSDDFKEIQYNDNGFTAIENPDYESILRIALNKNGITKEDFVGFFNEDKNTITRKQIAEMERVFDDILGSIKVKVNKTTLNENIKKIKKLWEVEQIRANKKFYLVTNSMVGRFVVGKKNGRIQIVYFPGSND